MEDKIKKWLKRLLIILVVSYGLSFILGDYYPYLYIDYVLISFVSAIITILSGIYFADKKRSMFINISKLGSIAFAFISLNGIMGSFSFCFSTHQDLCVFRGLLLLPLEILVMIPAVIIGIILIRRKLK